MRFKMVTCKEAIVFNFKQLVLCNTIILLMGVPVSDKFTAFTTMHQNRYSRTTDEFISAIIS